MSWLFEWYAKETLRKGLILTTVILLAIAMNQAWQKGLQDLLDQKEKEYSELCSLQKSKDLFQNRQKELDLFSSLKAEGNDAASWNEIVPKFISANHLILRQVRPLGIERVGKMKHEKTLFQVDGNVNGFLGLMHDIASLEKPVYVSRFFVSSEVAGSGFVTAEVVVSRLLVD